MNCVNGWQALAERGSYVHTAGRRHLLAPRGGIGLVLFQICEHSDKHLAQRFAVFNRETLQGGFIGLDRERFKVRSQTPTVIGKVDVLFAPISVFGAALDKALLLHLGQGGVHRRLGQVGAFAQFALRQAFLLPKYPQKDPLTKRNVIVCQTAGQRPVETARAKPREMSNTLILIDFGKALCRTLGSAIVTQSPVHRFVVGEIGDQRNRDGLPSRIRARQLIRAGMKGRATTLQPSAG